MTSIRPATSTSAGLSPDQRLPSPAMRRVGLEPTSPCGQRLLRPPPLPVWTPPPAPPFWRIAPARLASLKGAMCGRYTLTNPDPFALRARFGLETSVEVDQEPRYNIAPTDPVVAVRR